MNRTNSTGQPAASSILLIEDDANLAGLIADYLRQHEFTVHIECRGDEGARCILSEQPDLVILDVMLPGMDGMKVCQQVRTRFANPILMLTARDDDIDQVLGLELGADDYVKKPVEPRVLLARVRAALRRSQVDTASAQADTLSFGALLIDRASRRVVLDQAPVELTTTEFELLWLLAANASKVLSRDLIFSSLRGIDYDGLDRSIDIAISRLRNKLRDIANPPARIKTVRGRGYLFVTDAW